MLRIILYLMLISSVSFNIKADSCVYDEKTLGDNLSKYIESFEVIISKGQSHYAVYIYFQDKISGYDLNGASFEIEDEESSEVLISIPLDIRNDENRKLLSFLVDKGNYRYSKVSIFYKRCGLVLDIRLKNLDSAPLSQRVRIK
ncbi:hypothetical protein BAE46_13995 [Glaciecola punicea]|uniref:hypothetical protein n=1 Tax=Glaciecola punicea TaxID=56804 RepID=UPI000871EEFE|nr:hypothetical protein [Glaciecola punicea]OFA29689.1 hypothetical protein BAE46_13995 [Glaciecola punicea]